MKTTRDQLLAAESAYNASAREHRFGAAMLIPLEAALDAALAEVPEPAPAGTLTRAEALELAVKTTDHLAEVPMKPNGYPVDGWKAPSLAERTRAITELMEALLGGAA